MRAADFVDGGRLWQRHVDMAAIGNVGETGVNRQAFSEEDIEARLLLADWARSLGLDSYTDAIGNLFFRHQPASASGDAILTGSHMDSQPSGGRFDGIYGVLAGLEAIQAIIESDITVRRPLEVVAWSNEEGSRFAPGAMGSMVFTGFREIDGLIELTDSDGVTLRTALATTIEATPQAEHRDFGFPVHAYIEAHVEQGPVLEKVEKQIGVVTGIQGCRWFEVEVTGEARHAGSTPLGIRKDALQSAIRIIHALNELTEDATDITRFTVGRFDVYPDSPNTVAERVVFTVDLRHPDSTMLLQLGDAIEAVAHDHAVPCQVTVTETFNHAPVQFDNWVTDTVAESAKSLSLPTIRIASGAFHDAMFLANHCPTGMIFVPSARGISHHPDEFTHRDDLAAGARVLTESIVALIT